MRYIKPHYYDSFTCIADQCPATCCAGWQIVIDEDSLEKYGKVPGAFGRRLRDSIDWQESAFFQNNRRCAFLNDKDLCDLYSELGPEALCDTCRMYPRHVEEYEGLREYSLSLSCPEAAKIILACREKVTFKEWETEEEDDFEEFDFLMFTQLEDARDIIFKIIQNRRMDLRLRMKMILELAEQFQKCVDEERIYEIDEMLDGYRQQAGHDVEGNFTADIQERYEEMCRNFPVFYKLELLRDDWGERLQNTWKCLFEKGSKVYENIYTQFQKSWGYESRNRNDWEIQGEQLLMFFVYTYFCGSVYDDEVYSKMVLSVFSTLWIQEFFMVQWHEKRGEAGFADMVETAYRYAREIEHSDLNLEALETWFARRQTGLN